MAGKRLVLLLAVMVGLTILGISAWSARAEEASRLTKEEVRGMLANPDVIILDVRSGPDWNEAKLKIQGAVREDPGKVDSWADKYPKGKALVLY